MFNSHCEITLSLGVHMLYIHAQINTQCTGKFRHLFTYKHWSIVHVLTPRNVSWNAHRNVLRKVSNTTDGKGLHAPRQVSRCLERYGLHCIVLGCSKGRPSLSKEDPIHRTISLLCCLGPKLVLQPFTNKLETILVRQTFYQYNGFTTGKKLKKKINKQKNTHLTQIWVDNS